MRNLAFVLAFGLLLTQALFAEDATVGQRLYVWGHVAGIYNDAYLKKLKPSKIEPIAGMEYLGLKNIFFIRYQNKPPLPIGAYYDPFKRAEKVVWSLTGESGATSAEERAAVFKLAAENKNIAGFIMDDFFHTDQNTPLTDDADAAKPLPAALTPEQVREIHEQLAAGQQLPLSVVVYTGQICPRAKHHLKFVDQITLWTWRPEDLDSLEKNLTRLESIANGKPIMLGCYLFDFNRSVALPVERMKQQTELGYRWLQAGRIKGMIFLGTPVLDIDLEAVEWTRQWIAKVKDEAWTGASKK